MFSHHYYMIHIRFHSILFISFRFSSSRFHWLTFVCLRLQWMLFYSLNKQDILILLFSLCLYLPFCLLRHHIRWRKEKKDKSLSSESYHCVIFSIILSCFCCTAKMDKNCQQKNEIDIAIIFIRSSGISKIDDSNDNNNKMLFTRKQMPVHSHSAKLARHDDIMNGIKTCDTKLVNGSPHSTRQESDRRHEKLIGDAKNVVALWNRETFNYYASEREDEERSETSIFPNNSEKSWAETNSASVRVFLHIFFSIDVKSVTIFAYHALLCTWFSFRLRQIVLHQQPNSEMVLSHWPKLVQFILISFSLKRIFCRFSMK